MDGPTDYLVVSSSHSLLFILLYYFSSSTPFSSLLFSLSLISIFLISPSLSSHPILSCLLSYISSPRPLSSPLIPSHLIVPPSISSHLHLLLQGSISAYWIRICVNISQDMRSILNSSASGAYCSFDSLRSINNFILIPFL